MYCININLTVLTNTAYEIFVHNCYMQYQNKTLYNKVFLDTNFRDMMMFPSRIPRHPHTNFNYVNCVDKYDTKQSSLLYYDFPDCQT